MVERSCRASAEPSGACSLTAIFTCDRATRLNSRLRSPFWDNPRTPSGSTHAMGPVIYNHVCIPGGNFTDIRITRYRELFHNQYQ